MKKFFNKLSFLGVDSQFDKIDNLITTIYNSSAITISLYLFLKAISSTYYQEPSHHYIYLTGLLPLLTLYLHSIGKYIWAKLNITVLLSTVTFLFWIEYGNETALGLTFIGYFIAAIITFKSKLIKIINATYIFLLVILGFFYNTHNDTPSNIYVSDFDIITNYSVTLIIITAAILYFIRGIKEQEKKLKHQQQALKKKNKELLLSGYHNMRKTELLKLLAHDLRGPISSYKNLSEKFNFLIKENDQDKIFEIAANMEQSSERLFSNIENLINWVLTQQHQITIDKKHISTLDIIKEIVDELEYLSNPKNIQFDISLQSNCMIYSDRNMIRIILRNLLDNAIKYSLNNSTIKIISYSEQSKKIIVIEDDGRGMNDETIAYLSENKEVKFNHTHTKGYGLGLTICQYFAKIIQANLIFKNKDDGGLSVKIELEN